MQPYTDRMCSTPLTRLIVRCYPGREGDHNTYTLYEDDGLTTAYQRGASATTALSYEKDAKQTVVTIHPARGSYDGQPQRRAYRIELPGIAAGAKVKVNGRKAKATYDASLRGMVVDVKAGDIRQAVTVSVENQ